MTAQDVILGARVLHVRELKAQIEALKAANDRLRRENGELREHFDLALTAARDLGRLPPGGRLVVVDGWNFILGAGRTARDPAQLRAHAEKYLAENPLDIVWIVFDGSRESVRNEGRLRISYTGGTGLQRADRFICDFVRMAAFGGDSARIVLKTRDKVLRREVAKIQSRAAGQTPDHGADWTQKGGNENEEVGF